MVDGVVHYCVANMPGGSRHLDEALTNATLPYVEAIADHGLAEAVARDPALARGVNVLDGKITYEAVAEAHDLDFTPLEGVLSVAAAYTLALRSRVRLLLRRPHHDRHVSGPPTRPRCRRRTPAVRGRRLIADLE